MTILFSSGSLQVSPSKAILILAGVDIKPPTFINSNLSWRGCVHPATGSGLKLRIGKWAARESGARALPLLQLPPHLFDRLPPLASLPPSAKGAGPKVNSPLPRALHPFAKGTTAEIFVMPWTGMKSKLSLGCKRANDSLCQNSCCRCWLCEPALHVWRLSFANFSLGMIGPG